MSKFNNCLVGGVVLLLAGLLSAQQKDHAPSSITTEIGRDPPRTSQIGSKNEATGDKTTSVQLKNTAGASKVVLGVTGKAESRDRAAGAEEGIPDPSLSGRDPFRPFVAKPRSKNNVRRRENLSPLERFEIAQLKLVGIIWHIKNPTALVEDDTGLGYVVKVGTPIGANDGKIKIIRQDSVLIEEEYIDLQGARKNVKSA